jgi:hypothetical protein
MRLVVDTRVLVGELLRAAGRDRLSDQRLELFLPEQMAEELTAGIWTHDHDFLGCGVPTWTTDTLERWLSPR